MKILAVSDTPTAGAAETEAGPFADCVDVVIGCGDLPPEYLAELGSRLQVPVLYVRGNHDLRYPHRKLAAATDLHGNVVSYAGVRIAGLEGCRWYNGGPAQYRELEMKAMVRRLSARIRKTGGLDVMVTHAPPWGLGDRPDRCHRGFKAFHRIIERHRPRLWLHGHIHHLFSHRSQRIVQAGDTRIVNCYGHVVLDIAPAQVA